MGKPTKEELKKRQKIIDLQLFVRDSFIYDDFEQRTNKLSKSRLSYVFCGECHKRNIDIDENLLQSFKNEEVLFGNHKHKKELEEKITVLRDINLSLSFYCLHIHLVDYTKALHEKDYKPYRLEEIELKVKEWEKYTTPSTIRLIYKNSTPFNPFRIIETGLKNEESHQVATTNSVFIELDLSKDKKELLEYIELIKDDYDEEPNNIFNHDFKPYECELEVCEIYKNKEPKPLNGRLADILFIYDCKKAGLHNEYIIDEINRYWNDVKNLFRDKIYEKTIKNYHKFAIEYIDDKKYKCHVSGYDLSKK